jgi:phage tail protein X
MSDRYNDIKILKTDTGKNYYKNVLYPEIPLSEDDIYVITNQGDRFDLLANQYYGDPEDYWIISIANEFLKQDSMFIPYGTQIRIPLNISEIKTMYQDLNKF